MIDFAGPESVAGLPPEPPPNHPLVAFEQHPANRIAVSASLRNPHPLVEKTAESLRNPNRTVHPLGTRKAARGCLDVTVTPNGIARALRIMQTLVRAAEARGFRFIAPPASDPDFSWMAPKYAKVRILDEDIEFGLLEYTKRKPNPIPKPKGTDSWSWRPYVYEPTGKFVLKINSYVGGGRFQWRDSGRHRVEGCLNEFMIGLIEAALYAQRRRAERAEQERRYQEAAQCAAAEERRAQVERASKEQLRSIAHEWAFAKRLNEFFDAVEDAVEKLQPQERERLAIRLGQARQLMDAGDALMRFRAWTPPTGDILGMSGYGNEEF